MDRYPYHEYTILLGATRALAHIGVHFYTPRFQPVKTRIVLRYFLISATALSDCASAHLVLRCSLISLTALSVNASALLFYATTPQYCTVPSDTYCVVSYSFLITGLGSQTFI